MERSLEKRPRMCFEVEKVIGVSSDGTYQVQWAPAWVSSFHLVGCEHLIQEFLDKQSENMSQSKRSADIPTFESQETDEVVYRQSENGGIVSDRETEIEPVPYELSENPLDSADYSLAEDDHDQTSNENCVFVSDTYEDCIKIEDEDDTTSEFIDTSPPSMVTKNSFFHQNTTLPYDSVEQSDSYTSHPYSLSTLPPNSQYNGPTYTCTICNRGCPSRHELEVHSRKHTGVRPYPCPHCPKAFTQSGNLKTHLRTHTGEKPFVCNICGKAFSHKVSLVKHIRSHTGIRPFSCHLCPKSFTQKYNLKLHLRQHVPDEASSKV